MTKPRGPERPAGIASDRELASPRQEKSSHPLSLPKVQTTASATRPRARCSGLLKDPNSGTPTAPGLGDPNGAQRPAPAPAPLVRSRADTRLAPPPARPAARPQPQLGPAREPLWFHTCGKKQVYPYHIGSCSRRRNRTAPSFRSSVTSLEPPQKESERAHSVAELGFDTLASSVVLVNSYNDESLTLGRLLCPFCCLH